MNILDFKEKPLFLLGDVHGEFNKLKEIIKYNNSISPDNQKKRDEENKKESRETIVSTTTTHGFFIPNTMNLKSSKKQKTRHSYVSDAVLVVCGDCGIGFNKEAYYFEIFTELQKLLEEDNLILLFLRGNHDNPEYFQTIEGKFNFPNIKFIPDYSVLLTKDNISLCVGGGVSQDRSWRIKENCRLNRFKRSFKKVIWWEDEIIQDSTETLDEIIKSGLKINSLITHVPDIDLLPKKMISEHNEINEEWYDNDPDLKKDMKRESQLLKNIIQTLTENGLDIQWWVCGHVHTGFSGESEIKCSDKTKKILLITLNILNKWVDSGNGNINLSNGYGLDNGVISTYTIAEHIKSQSQIKEEVKKITTLKDDEYLIKDLSEWQVDFTPNITVDQYIDDVDEINYGMLDMETQGLDRVRAVYPPLPGRLQDGGDEIPPIDLDGAIDQLAGMDYNLDNNVYARAEYIRQRPVWENYFNEDNERQRLDGAF